jgi:signal peptidase I
MENTTLDQAVPEQPKTTVSVKKTILLWVRDIAIALVLAIILMQFVRPTIVNGQSMENTLHDRDYLLVNRQADEASDLKHGDIIVFQSDLTTMDDKAMKLIKRVIGTPGDRIYIKDGSVYRNDKKLEDAYTKDGVTNGDMEEVKVPAGAVFVLGDNRQNSEDSRFSDVGFVTSDRLVGRAFFRILPARDFGVVK